MQLTRGRVAGLVAAASGALGLLLFFVAPFATFGFIGLVTGSFTGSQVARLSDLDSSFGVLWLVAVAAAVIAALGLWLGLGLASPAGQRLGFAGIVAAAGTAVVVDVLALGRLRSAVEQVDRFGGPLLGLRATQFAGSGYWLVLACMLLALAVAALGLGALVRRRASA